MAKKSIFHLDNDDTGGSKLNYKNIFIAIGVIVAIILISFMSFGGKNKKKVGSSITTADKINESESVATTTEEMEKIITENPLLNAEVKDTGESNEMEKLRLQHELEMQRMAMQLEQQRLANLKAREGAGLVFLQASNINELPKQEEKKDPYQILADRIVGSSSGSYVDMFDTDDNLQKNKKQFASQSTYDDFILQRNLTSALSRYEVKAGTIIPLTLETAINSDLPGRITAVVKTDVYDSATGNILLIPAGSRVIGKYSSDVSFGQERVQVVFNRITLPNQKSLNIEAMLGVDQLGASGVKDRVDTKLGKVFTSVVMSAILGVGAGAVKEDDDSGDSWKNDAIDGGGTQAINVGNAYANKVLNVQPSLNIRQGYTVGLFVEKDLQLEPYAN